MSGHEDVADVLDGAADVIERDGHHKGWLVDDAGRAVCVLGAIGRVTGLLDGIDWAAVVSDWTPVDAAREAIQKVLPPDFGVDDIPDWNDAYDRTKQEVLDALRLAARQERRLADAEDGAA